jgi:anti-sigma factor RsiW
VTPVYRSGTCERSRAWAAFSVDEELSLLERRLLDAHLARCAECATFAADVVAATEALRGQPLESAPARVALSGHRTRRAAKRLPLAGKAAAVAAVAVGAFSFGSLSSPDTPDATQLRPVIIDGATAAAAQAEPEELRTYRHALLLEEAGATPVAAGRTGPQPL